MLILARKVGEAITIDGNISIRVLDIKGGQARLGIDAPQNISVHREEVYLRILEENRRAAMEAPVDLAGLDVAIDKDGRKKPEQT